jgi:dihydropteroate synthase
MGVLNVTPDSFYAASRVHVVRDALERGLAMFADGASIVDVGGESTRPGASTVDLADELARVVPVIEALAPLGRVSVDTVKAEVARAAVAAGASLINDVRGDLGGLAAELGVGWVRMHHRGIPAGTANAPLGVVGLLEVHDALLEAARTAKALGVEELYLDVGLGFGKTGIDNLSLVAGLDALCDEAHAAGFGVLLGASRKRFLGALPHGAPLEAEDRFEGSLAVATYAMACGVDVVRVHDVAATAQAAAIVADGEAA